MGEPMFPGIAVLGGTVVEQRKVEAAHSIPKDKWVNKPRKWDLQSREEAPWSGLEQRQHMGEASHTCRRFQLKIGR